MNEMKSIIMQLALNLLSAIIIGFLLMCLVFCLPVERIDENVRKSAYTIQKEGTYPQVSKYCASQLDNFTDSIMLLEAADLTEGSVPIRAMSEFRGTIGNLDPAQVLISHYVDGMEYDRTFSYTRYWHGYLVILKPLLEFIDYRCIRVLNGITQVFLLVLSLILLYRERKGCYVIIWLLAYLMLMPVALVMSLQYSPCFYISIIASSILLSLRTGRRERLALFVLLNTGIMTAFFDFLTYPIATFGIPAIIYLTLLESDSLKKRIREIIKLGFCWCSGYAGMWISKWIIATAITGEDIIKNGIENVSKHTSNVELSQGLKFTPLKTIFINYRTFFETPVTFLLIVLFVFLTYRLIINYIKYQKNFYKCGGGTDEKLDRSIPISNILLKQLGLSFHILLFPFYPLPGMFSLCIIQQFISGLRIRHVL